MRTAPPTCCTSPRLSSVPTADIIIRTKNRPLFLARALDDVLAQEFNDWHLYVVQDGTDPAPTQALIDERDFGDKVTLVVLPEPQGIPAAANRGIEAGTGEFIAIHDDDDTWHPAFLARTVEHLQEGDDIAVATRTEIIFEQQVGEHLVETGREVFHPLMPEPTLFDLLRFNHVVPISLLFTRAAWEDLGPMDERCEVVDDWVFNLALAQTGRLGWIDEVLAYWHQRPTARGDAANTVVGAQDLHFRDDRRVRDRALREYVNTHGSGGLLYLAKYIDERTADLHARIDAIEAQQQEILDLLRKANGNDGGWLKRRR